MTNTMKVGRFLVNVKTLSGETVPLQFETEASETAADLKARILLAEPNPFPEQVLMFKGHPMKDTVLLADCDMEQGAELAFEAKATEVALAVQLAALLPAKGGISMEELGLLYSLKHGVTVGLVLQSLGKQQLTLPAFLQHFIKYFDFEAGQVRAAAKEIVSSKLQKIPEDVAVQRLALEVSVFLELPYATLPCEAVQLAANAGDSVRSVKDRIAAAVQVPFTDRQLTFEGGTLEDSKTLADSGVVDHATLSLAIRCTEIAFIAQLMLLLRARGPTSRTELDNMYCCRFGASASCALSMLGWGEKLQDFMQRQAFFFSSARLGRDAPPSPRLARLEEENRKYVQLHTRLTDEQILASLPAELDALAELVTKEVFLNVTRVEKGGGLAKGTAIVGDCGAELVLFVEGLQLADRDRWLPPLAAGIAGVLSQSLVGRQGVSGVRAASDGTVRVSTTSALGEVRVLLSPEFGSYSQALEALKGQKPESARSGGEAAFVAQRVRFVQRQPPAVKATARLLRHWRAQKQWASDSTRPSDDLLELIAGDVAARRRPADLRSAVEAVLVELADFEHLEVAAWPLASRCYREGDVAKALLKQRPLLLDPTNPLANLADASCFQPAEMMKFAREGFSL